jgi:hypothetical protein
MSFAMCVLPMLHVPTLMLSLVPPVQLVPHVMTMLPALHLDVVSPLLQAQRSLLFVVVSQKLHEMLETVKPGMTHALPVKGSESDSMTEGSIEPELAARPKWRLVQLLLVAEVEDVARQMLEVVPQEPYSSRRKAPNMSRVSSCSDCALELRSGYLMAQFRHSKNL